MTDVFFWNELSSSSVTTIHLILKILLHSTTLKVESYAVYAIAGQRLSLHYYFRAIKQFTMKMFRTINCHADCFQLVLCNSLCSRISLNCFKSRWFVSLKNVSLTFYISKKMNMSISPFKCLSAVLCNCCFTRNNAILTEKKISVFLASRCIPHFTELYLTTRGLTEIKYLLHRISWRILENSNL